MPTTPIEDVLDRQALQSGPLGTVMLDCVAIRDEARQSYTVVDIAQLSKVKRVYTTRPALLVIAAGFFLVASAAYASRDGGNADIPLGLLGAAFVVAYFLTRRASVVFTSGRGTIESMCGPLSQANDLYSAVAAIRFNHLKDETTSKRGIRALSPDRLTS